MTAEAMDVDSASQTAVVTKDAVESIVDMDQNNSARAEDAANPEFSKFMQGFWDLANVDVPVRCVAMECGLIRELIVCGVFLISVSCPVI